MPATPFLEVSEAIALMGGDTLYQCMQCGLCSGLCPWPAVDSPFRTRQLIKMGQLGLEGFESDDILYACTTCKLCVENCPREVKIIDVIRAMRAMIAESGAAPKSLSSIMGSIHSKGNPWSEERDKREKWTEGLDIPASTAARSTSSACAVPQPTTPAPSRSPNPWSRCWAPRA